MSAFSIQRLSAALLIVGLAGVSLPAAADYISTVQAKSPTFWWRFEDASSNNGTTALNSGSLGAADNGVYNNGGNSSLSFTAGVPGIGGQAVNLTAGSVSGTDAGLPTGNANRSFIGWVKTTKNPTGDYPTIFNYGSDSPNSIYSVLMPQNNDANFNAGVTGELGISFYGDGVGGTRSIRDGNWHFIAVTTATNAGGGLNVRLYVDGTLEAAQFNNGASQAPPSLRPVANTTLNGTATVGAHFGQFVGAIDEPAMFNTVLSDADVAQIYNSVPEPASMGALGVAGLALLARRRRA